MAQSQIILLGWVCILGRQRADKCYKLVFFKIHKEPYPGV